MKVSVQDVKKAAPFLTCVNIIIVFFPTLRAIDHVTKQ